MGWGATQYATTDYYFSALEQEESSMDTTWPNSTRYDFPDFVLGRFPFDDASQIATLANKTIAYEQNNNLGNWTRTHLSVLGKELEELQYPLADSITDRPHLKLVSGENLTSASVIDIINQGVGSVYIAAHANPSGWVLNGQDFFDITDILSLSNSRLPVIFSLGCHSGKFDVGIHGSSSIAVQLLGMSGGAVAFVSGTYYSPHGDYVLASTFNWWPSPKSEAVGLRLWMPNSNYHLGKAFYFLNALDGVYENNILLGDPSLVLATSEYDSITLPEPEPEPHPPIASFTFSPIDPQVNDTITFDASS